MYALFTSRSSFTVDAREQPDELTMRSAPARGSVVALNVPSEFERAVTERVESGQYGSSEEVFETCLELLREYEERRDALLRKLDEAIEEYDRGEEIDGPTACAAALEEYWRLVGR